MAPTSNNEIATPKNTADFDALMNDAVAPAATASDLSFDQLPQDKLSPQAETVEEITPLDFSTLSLDSTAEAATPAAEEVKPLDFGHLNFNTTTTEETKVETAPVQDIQPLDFSFSLDTAATEQPAIEKTPHIEPVLEENLNLILISRKQKLLQRLKPKLRRKKLSQA